MNRSRLHNAVNTRCICFRLIGHRQPQGQQTSCLPQPKGPRRFGSSWRRRWLFDQCCVEACVPLSGSSVQSLCLCLVSTSARYLNLPAGVRTIRLETFHWTDLPAGVRAIRLETFHWTVRLRWHGPNRVLLPCVVRQSGIGFISSRAWTVCRDKLLPMITRLSLLALSFLVRYRL